MTCDELRPDYLLYALGTLEDPERTELREHLARGCDNCTAGLREARAWAYAMGSAAEAPEPSKALRNRIVAAAGGAPEKRSNWWAVLVAAAATAAAAAVLIFVQAQNFRGEREQLQTAIERNRTDAAGLREMLALIESPETKEVSFGQGKPAPPKGRVFVHPTGVLLIANNLPAPPQGKAYEMWIIPAGGKGKPVPAGVFTSSTQGEAVHLFRPAKPATATDVVAVTLENAAGVDAPTSTPIIVAPLQ